MTEATHADLGIGIIGFGRIGAEHAGWITAAAGTRVAGVFDPTPARRALASAAGHATVDSIQALLDHPRVTAVLVATPTSMHAAHATAALQAGRHVMVEKPVTLDAPAARELIAAARDAGRVLSVFHCRRWDVDYLTVRHAVASGQLGRIINVESRLGQWGSCVGPAAREYRPNWRNEAAFGGGGLFDWGSHFVDQIWQLLLPARPVRVFAQLRGNVWSSDCDDFARVVIDFDTGAAAMTEINTTTTRPLPRWHVDGTAGSGQSPFSLEFDTRRWGEFDITPADGSPEVRVRRTHETPLNELVLWQRFAAACRGQGQPAVTPESVLPTMILLDAARQSSREGRAVEVKID